MKTLLFVVQLIPAIINLIKAIETAIPVSGAGADKLELIREILDSTYDGITEIWPTLEKIINTLVAVFNKTGVFQKEI